MLKVRTLRPGFHGRLREPGEVFEIASRRELGSWMEPLERRRLKLSLPQEEPAADSGEDPSTGSG